MDLVRIPTPGSWTNSEPDSGPIRRQKKMSFGGPTEDTTHGFLKTTHSFDPNFTNRMIARREKMHGVFRDANDTPYYSSGHTMKQNYLNPETPDEMGSHVSSSLTGESDPEGALTDKNPTMRVNRVQQETSGVQEWATNPKTRREAISTRLFPQAATKGQVMAQQDTVAAYGAQTQSLNMMKQKEDAVKTANIRAPKNDISTEGADQYRVSNAGGKPWTWNHPQLDEDELPGPFIGKDGKLNRPIKMTDEVRSKPAGAPPGIKMTEKNYDKPATAQQPWKTKVYGKKVYDAPNVEMHASNPELIPPEQNPNLMHSRGVTESNAMTPRQTRRRTPYDLRRRNVLRGKLGRGGLVPTTGQPAGAKPTGNKLLDGSAAKMEEKEQFGSTLAKSSEGMGSMLMMMMMMGSTNNAVGSLGNSMDRHAAQNDQLSSALISGLKGRMTLQREQAKEFRYLDKKIDKLNGDDDSD